MHSNRYQNRQNLEFFAWPELRDNFLDLVDLVMVKDGNITQQLRAEIFTMASVASGCLHCQSHGAYSLHLMDVDEHRIRSIWKFEQSELFSEAEKVALRLARDGASVPNMVEASHFTALRDHYSDRQIVEMLAVISLAGWYNRWNDSIATVTDQESVDWANEHLKQVGWDQGKHKGEKQEQRKKHPRSTDMKKVEY
jgi:alkylhydroperoxidase family enzyme